MKIFVNLPVKNLEASRTFYTALGYRINEQFSNDQAACIVMSEDIYVMLLTHHFFKSLGIEKDIADAGKVTEVINAFSCDSRASVDDILRKALAAGGKLTGQPEDLGYMYSQAFEDLDGHYWNAVFMDMAAA